MQKNKMLEKFFTVPLSGEEWSEILNEWGAEAQWLTLDPEASNEFEKYHLLNRWAFKNPPPEEAIDWLHDHLGDEAWVTQDGNGWNVLNVLLHKGRTDQNIDSTMKGLVKHVQREHLIEAAQRDNERELASYPNAAFEGTPLNEWHGDMAVVVNLLHNRRHDALGTYLKAFPEAFKATEHHVTVGMLMAVSEKGWQAYVQSGGSLFEKNNKDPLTNKITDKAMPLWLWLIQRKVYHPQIKSALSNLLIRLHEDRPPQEGELVISEGDWKELNQHKTLIHNEMQMIEFEKNINEDWKSSIKSNKLWREWRSTDGANFMFWLAAKRPGDFLKQAVKIKKNHSLIQGTDGQGRDIALYLITGLMTQDLGSWRRAEKLTREIWPGAWRDLKPDLNLSPVKGLFAECLESPDTAMFENISRVEKSHNSYHQSHLLSVFKDNPGLFWNGIDEHNLKQVFSSSKTSQRVARMIGALGQGTTLETFKTQLDELTPTARGVLLTICVGFEILNGWNPEIRTEVMGRVKNMVEQHHDLNFNLQPEEYQKMLEWIKNNVRAWSKPEWISEWETTLEKLSLMKTLENAKPEEVERPVASKRRM